jgi:hypothetical protein
MKQLLIIVVAAMPLGIAGVMPSYLISMCSLCTLCPACEFGGALAAELAFACHVFAVGKAKGLYAHSNFSRSKV